MIKIKKLSIIVPVYNEVGNIDAILAKLEKLQIGETEKEIVIVDDGSTDGTREKLAKYKERFIVILQEKNQGKGSAVRAGYAVASGDYAIVQDADLEYDPEDIKLLVGKAEATDATVVFGSRTLGMRKLETPGMLYFFGGHLLTALTNFLYGTKITDEPTCYKMFHKDIYKSVQLDCNGFEFCPEITAKAAMLGHKIEEVPISYKTRSKAEGKKIKLFKDGYLAIWTLIKYRFNSWLAIKGFALQYKWWLFLLFCFLAVRIVLFTSLWSIYPNGWDNFYQYAQSGPHVLLATWHEFCDWHPPLYYFFTTLIITIFKKPWLIFLLQVFVSFVNIVLINRIAKRFFSKRVAFISAFLIAIEPYSAWHEFMLTAEIFYTLPLLLATDWTLSYIQNSKKSNLAFAGIIIAIATLTRLNSMALTAALSILILFVFFARKPFKLPYFSGLKFKNILTALLIFNGVYLAVLFPWQMHNKLEYGKYSVANVLFTNFYICNYPTALSIRDNISYEDAQKIVADKAEKALGKNVGDQGDCSLYGKEELSRQFDFYQQESSRYIKENFWQYTRLHLIRSLPFFLDSGYLNLIQEYSGVYAKPDITGSLMKGDIATVIAYLKNINFSLIAYLFGLAFWGLCSLSVFLGMVYVFFKDRTKFVFFLLSAGIIVYTALLCSPFVLARYRLPVYIFFLVPLVYMIGEVYKTFKKKND